MKHLIDNGKMPRLGGLLAKGRWSEVVASELGSATVWPSFLRGEDPHRHEVFSEWLWDPQAMRLRRFPSSQGAPFYESLRAKGVIVGTLDVPFDVVTAAGFAVREWGAHYVIDGTVSADPKIAREVVGSIERHPYSTKLLRPEEVDDLKAMRETVDGSIRGVSLRGDLAEALMLEVRPDLALITFQEAHHAGHFLWHTRDPEHPLYVDVPHEARYLSQGIKDVYEAIDRQIGRLVESTEPESVVIFSLNGMEPYRGTPDLLTRLMHRDGYSKAPDPRARDVKSRLSAFLAHAKRRSPKWAKELYHRMTSREFQRSVVRATILEQLEWSGTRAFTLPPEELSLVRLNLRGRESQGIVDARDYESLLQEVADKIETLRTPDGTSAAKVILKPNIAARQSLLPDLIVHWNHEVTHPPGKIVGFPDHTMLSTHHTGHHRPIGFCVSHGPISDELPERILCEDLHRPIMNTFA